MSEDLEKDKHPEQSVYERISQDHIDALQEIGNIGSGHAANALSELLNRKIDMSLPRFNLLTTTELSQVQWREHSPGDAHAVVIVESTGELLLHILVIFDQPTLQGLIKLIRPSPEAPTLGQLSSLDKSILQEIGNILALHYLTAITSFLHKKSIPVGPPNILIEASETVLTNIATQFATDFTHVLLIECDVFTSDLTLSPLVILIPEERTLDTLIKHLFGE
ncbi:MAG: chemotaxis protein CheC [Candidatus Hodarchaeota archaeon]